MPNFQTEESIPTVEVSLSQQSMSYLRHIVSGPMRTRLDPVQQSFFSSHMKTVLIKGVQVPVPGLVLRILGCTLELLREQRSTQVMDVMWRRL